MICCLSQNCQHKNCSLCVSRIDSIMVKIASIVQKINSISATFNPIVHKINSVQRRYGYYKQNVIIYTVSGLQLSLKWLWMSRRNRPNNSNSKPRDILWAPQQHACVYFKANVRDSEVHAQHRKMFCGQRTISLIRFMRSLFSVAIIGLTLWILASGSSQYWPLKHYAIKYCYALVAIK